MIEAEGFSSYLEALRERIINNPNDGKAANELKRLLLSNTARKKAEAHNSTYPESIRLQNNLTKEK